MVTLVGYSSSMTKTCDYEISNGNMDDPEYAYCSLPFAHAGEHGEWRMPYSTPCGRRADGFSA